MKRQLLWIALLVALAQADPGRVIGVAPSAVVDPGGRVVGPGPDLLLAELTEPEPEQAPESFAEALDWLRNLLGGIGRLEKELVTIKFALRTGAKEIAELRRQIADLRRTGERSTNDEFKEFCREHVADDEAELARLVAEQERLIAAGEARWGEILVTIEEKQALSKDFPQFQAALTQLQTMVEQKRTLSELELILAAGRSDEFRAKAVPLQGDETLGAPILLMRVADYIEQGDGRSALYAVRLGQERYPNQPAFGLFGQSLETSYLRMIAGKATSDGANVHKAWSEYGDSVSDSYIKQFFFGGLTRTLEYYTGRTDALEAVHGSAVDRAVMEANGLQLMARLRDKGLSFDEIRGLTSDQLRDRVNTLFGLDNPISEQSALGLSLALRAAFSNDDVQRLMIKSKEQFDVDMGRSYYGAEEFDQGILEYAVDAINVKNVLLLCGPSTVVSYAGQEAGLLARLAQNAGAPEKLARFLGTNPVGAVTARDWLLARPSMNQALGFLAKTQAGRAAARGLEAARYLRYDASAPIQVAAGVAEAAAQMILFEVGGKVGHALGGDLGEFIGQAMAVLVGNPVADLQQRTEAAAMRATAERMAAARTKWQQTNEALSRVRLPIRNAAAEAAAGRTLSAAEQQTLGQAVAEAETIAAQARTTIQAGDGALVRAAADEAEALAAAGRATVAGDTVAATLSDDVARSLEQQATVAVKQLDEATVAVGGMAARPATVPVNPRPRGTIAAENETWVSAAEQTIPATTIAARPPGVARPPVNPITRGAMELGDDAMRAGDFAAAEAHFRVAFLDAQDDAARALLSSRVREARQAARYHAALEARAARPAVQQIAAEADEAMLPFSAVTRQHLQGVRYADTVPIAGTAGGPRRVLGPNGETIGIWKPAQAPGGQSLGQVQGEGQQVAEVLNAQLARELNLRVPHSEAMTLREVDAAGNVIEHAGVISRFIPHSQELNQLTRGARAAVAAQVAEFRPLQTMMGNYDVHMGNYRIDRAGRVWAIDAGISIYTPTGPAGPIAGRIPGWQSTGDDALDWALFSRDFYANAHSMDSVRLDVGRLDAVLPGSRMAPIGRRIQGLGDPQLRRILEQALPPTHPEFDGILEVLRSRRDGMPRIIGRWTGPGGGALLLFPRRGLLALRPAA